MRKLTFQPGTSFFHMLYPLDKLIWLLLLSALVLIVTKGLLTLLLALLALISLIWLCPQIWIVRGFRLVFFTGIFLFVIYLLFEKTGAVLWDPGIKLLQITQNGIDAGLLFSSRFLAIVLMSYLFILTTNPSDLAYALMKAGLPYRFGFMLITALRLAPILEDEGQTIYQAQLVRGVRYDQGSLKRIPLLVQQFMTPLLISALRRADKLVFSMEGRGFGQYRTRTFRNRVAPSYRDLIFNILLVALSTFILVFNYGGRL
ncbi:MAG: energy-coupling factor transporter transmembrane protein EcfT [Anaerolineaceae bacterium]|nr:energy-coupling factor transporter transmembrane protein EcfT [Anaerolineaceae bacterium]